MSAQPADVVPVCSISEAMFRVNHWFRVTRGGVHLGFNSRSVIGRTIEEGAQGAAHDRGSPPPTWMAPADEEVDKILSRMPPELREAVMLDQDRNLRMKDLCTKMHCTPAEAHRRINAGYGFVAGVLTASAMPGVSPHRLLRLSPRGRG